MSGEPQYQRIGRYEVEGLIGEGSMAWVYRARDPEIGRTVAIKVLKDRDGFDREYLARFQREAQSAGGISHPHIVTIYDVGWVDGMPYITMEYLAERSLAALLSEGKKLPLSQVLLIAVQLASALDFAHRRGVVHRDVKPENILLFDGGSTIKLTDFGIARCESGEEVQRTVAGTVLGTPRYMSPEQASSRELDGRSDLFSLGAILYELLTGRKAFDKNNLAMLMLQIMQQDPVPIASIDPTVPVGLQRIVAKLLSKRPEQRYASGAQLVDALQREIDSLTRQEEAARNSYGSLRLKLAFVSGAALALMFLISMSLIYAVEARVLRNQLFDSGASLAKFVAVHSALPVLGQNWLPLRVFVEDAQSRSSFDYLAVVDNDHVVQASTIPSLVGKHFHAADGGEAVEADSDVAVSSAVMGGREVYLFNTPILFQKVEIGRIYLGVSKAGITRVLHATLWLMTSLLVLAVLAVGSLSFLFGRYIARPLRTIRIALEDFAAGDLDRRISEVRKDEFGALFAAFNNAAENHRLRTMQDRPPVQPLRVLPPIEGETDATLEVSATG
ncbi:MAG: protein kinase [Alphaproteobacteria bacterium]|nr:protein kinase [Alphaproteobacteria bacterium]